MNEPNETSSTPIFDAMADRGILDPEVLEAETANISDADAASVDPTVAVSDGAADQHSADPALVDLATEDDADQETAVELATAGSLPVGLEDTTDLPPDAAARDAARRESAGPVDEALDEAEFHFVTRGVNAEDRAAVIAVLTEVRAAESRRVRQVERREHQPWARSQRVPEGISELLAEG